MEKEVNPDVRDTFVDLVNDAARVALPLIIGNWVVRNAFAYYARREILRNDKYTCQSPMCVGYEFDEQCEPRSMHHHAPNSGWMVTAAHYPDMHRNGVDRDYQNGRALCVCCHFIEEINRGNTDGAFALYNSLSIRTKRWINDANRSDERIPFEQLVEIAKSR